MLPNSENKARSGVDDVCLTGFRLSRGESLIHLAGALDVVARSRRGAGHPARSSALPRGKGMRGVRMAHAVQAGASQLLCGRRMVGAEDIGGLIKEAPDHVPQSRSGNARGAALFDVRDERRFRIG